MGAASSHMLVGLSLTVGILIVGVVAVRVCNLVCNFSLQSAKHRILSEQYSRLALHNTLDSHRHTVGSINSHSQAVDQGDIRHLIGSLINIKHMFESMSIPIYYSALS